MTATRLIRTLSSSIINAASQSGVMIATAESCTGGMITAALTDVPGSSAAVDRGFVTYSNAAKAEMLGVSMALIERHGAVSASVARAMAEGAIRNARADIAVSVTGIAGPGGGAAEKPVGLVWFGLAVRDGEVRTEKRLFINGSRAFVRTKAVETGLRLLLLGLNR